MNCLHRGLSLALCLAKKRIAISFFWVARSCLGNVVLCCKALMKLGCGPRPPQECGWPVPCLKRSRKMDPKFPECVVKGSRLSRGVCWWKCVFAQCCLRDCNRRLPLENSVQASHKHAIQECRTRACTTGVFRGVSRKRVAQVTHKSVIQEKNIPVIAGSITV